MKYRTPSIDYVDAKWLFTIGQGSVFPKIDGLVAVKNYNPEGRSPEEVALVEKAESYGAIAVFFEIEHYDWAPVAQAFIFNIADHDNSEFADLHRRLWSWGGVPVVYRAGPDQIQLFRCAHGPDFINSDGIPICNPYNTLDMDVRTTKAWWDAERIRNGSIWDDQDICRKMLSATRSAHRALMNDVRIFAQQMSKQRLFADGLQRKLLIQVLLIAYLEERSVLQRVDFDRALPGSTRFLEVLGNGPALISFLETLANRFNCHVFNLNNTEKDALHDSDALENYARLVEGFKDSSGEFNFRMLYSFRDLPVELISNIYQIFVKDDKTAIYTPPALVRLILGEALSWKRIDNLVQGEGVILDPACGSGVFLVETYKRLILHWRQRNDWARPGIDVLRALLQRLHGIDLEKGAIEIAAFSLCIGLCDEAQPEEIHSGINIFPQLDNNTLHCCCFFSARERRILTAPVEIVVGNPPFESKRNFTTAGAQRSYDAYFNRTQCKLPDKQLAYLFIHEAMEILEPDGILAIIEPAGILYNKKTIDFRNKFFERWTVREVLDFVSVRGLFKKGKADLKVVVIIAEATKPGNDSSLLHAVFRRSWRTGAEQGFDIDYYDMHHFPNSVAIKSRDIWRANLMGGYRVHELIQRLRAYPTLNDFAQKMGWDFGEGYIAGKKNISKAADHLVGKQLLPTRSLSAGGLDTGQLEVVPDKPIKDPKTERRFTPPLLLIKKHKDLYNGFHDKHYLTYMSEIVGFAAPIHDVKHLLAISNWLKCQATVMRAYVAGISPRLFTQRATVISSDDVLALPYPENGKLDLSENEEIVASDIVKYQGEFIRLGAKAAIMDVVDSDALNEFDKTFIKQINAIYTENRMKVLSSERWPGAICKAYVFGDGEVDWSGSDELRKKLCALLREKHAPKSTVMRITRFYDNNFLFLLKPDIHRYWTRSIALRDADDVFSDLRAQGF